MGKLKWVPSLGEGEGSITVLVFMVKFWDAYWAY